MEKKEVAELLTLVAKTYPNVKMGPGETKELTVAWYALLGDIEYRLARAAVLRILREGIIPSLPTPGKIRRAAVALVVKVPSETEALTELYAAVKFQNTATQTDEYTRRYPSPEKGLGLLSPLVRKVATGLGWKTICDNDAPEVIRGLFRKLYAAEVDGLMTRFVNTEIGNGKGLLALVCGPQPKQITGGE